MEQDQTQVLLQDDDVMLLEKCDEPLDRRRAPENLTGRKAVFILPCVLVASAVAVVGLVLMFTHSRHEFHSGVNAILVPEQAASAVRAIQRKAASASRRPFITLHGVGDACVNPGVGNFTLELQKALPGVYGTCIEYGSNSDSWFTTMDIQVDRACSMVNADPQLAQGFNIVALSQGALVARGLIQQCAGVQVYNFVSLGGPHMGVARMPTSTDTLVQQTMSYLLQYGIYSNYVQNRAAPANYYKAPDNFDTYLKDCHFLPDLNNEREPKNILYTQAIALLNKMVLIKFEDDTVYDPPDTEWFGFYAPGGIPGSGDIIPLQDSAFYQQDWLGLKNMDSLGKLKLVATPGQHLNITTALVANSIIPALDNAF